MHGHRCACASLPGPPEKPRDAYYSDLLCTSVVLHWEPPECTDPALAPKCYHALCVEVRLPTCSGGPCLAVCLTYTRPACLGWYSLQINPDSGQPLRVGPKLDGGREESPGV